MLVSIISATRADIALCTDVQLSHDGSAMFEHSKMSAVCADIARVPQWDAPTHIATMKKLVFSHASVIPIVSMAAASRSRPRYDPMYPCRDQIAFSANREARSLAAFVMLLLARFPGQSCSTCSYFTGVGFCPFGGVRIWRENAVPCVEFKAFRSSAR